MENQNSAAENASAEQEFDHLAPAYKEMLNDSVRDYFAPESEFFFTRKVDMLLAVGTD